MSDQPIVITLAVYPVQKGARKVIASAAPAGEMPLIETGTFAERIDLIDRVWLGLLKRKPQVVKLAAGTPDTQAKSKPSAGSQPDDASPPSAPESEPSTAVEPAEAPADQLAVATPPVEPETVIEESPEPLPAIEGDHVDDSGAPDFVQAALLEEANV